MHNIQLAQKYLSATHICLLISVSINSFKRMNPSGFKEDTPSLDHIGWRHRSKNKRTLLLNNKNHGSWIFTKTTTAVVSKTENNNIIKILTFHTNLNENNTRKIDDSRLVKSIFLKKRREWFYKSQPSVPINDKLRSHPG